MQPHPMPEFGSFSLLLALVLSVYTLVGGGLALGTSDSFSWSAKLGETARRAGIASFIATACAAFALIWASYTCDYSVSYILHHTNRALWWPYKFSAVWSGQEGSLLLWAFLLSAYGFVLRVRHRVDVRLTAFASTILAGIQVFFLTMVTMPSTTHPFAIEPGPLHTDGFGLSPLLQYAEMMIHPPMLYLGYVGFSVPFAFALGALMMRYPGEKWIHITRRWTMVTWMFLTVGIFLGAHWAYSVLGWGGYWGWDPVENASLMPWLTGTAFLHSVMMQEKRGMMKTWNVWLIFSTFMLTILGTLLTRSGLVQSVHAFAQSNIGDWFYGFLLITFAICLFAFFRNRDHLKSENKLESLVSRESSFLFNNLILLVACFTVLWGTLFPVLSEYVTGTKATVNAPYYNRVNVPIGLFLLFLTGVGPLLAWRSTSLRSIRRNFILPGMAFAVTAIVLMIAGVRPWNDGDDMHATLFSLMTLSLAAGVITAIGSEFLRGANVVRTQTGKNLISATLTLVHRNTRRYGGYVVHFGIVVMFIGIAGGAFNQNHEMEMGFGDSVQMGTYRLVCQSFSQDSNPNYDTEYALLDVYKNGKKITQLAPEHRFYIASQQPSTIVAIHSTLQSDLYVVYEGKNPDTDKPIIKVFLNPLMSWIWIGVGIVVAGTLLGLAPNLARSAFKAAAAAPESQLVEAESIMSKFIRSRMLQAAMVFCLAIIMLGAGDSAANLDKRYERIGHNMMCACSCGQILLECNHVGCPDSARMDNELRTLVNGGSVGGGGAATGGGSTITQGGSDRDILNWFVEKYGAMVLASPIRGGFDNVAWIMPISVFLLAILGTALIARVWKARTPQRVPLKIKGMTTSSTDELRERIRRETHY